MQFLFTDAFKEYFYAQRSVERNGIDGKNQEK